jgi:hypothetical protein
VLTRVELHAMCSGFLHQLARGEIKKLFFVAVEEGRLVPVEFYVRHE